jgi:hypothetical protein
MEMDFECLKWTELAQDHILLCAVVSGVLKL